MPELPEVEIVRRGLNDVVAPDRAIVSAEVLLPRTIAHPATAESFVAGIVGCRIKHWQRRGKYLLAECLAADGKLAGWWGVHLRMTGQMLWVESATPVAKHVRVRVLLSDGKELRFVDQRTFGKMWWIDASEEPQEIISGLGKMGLEPLEDGFTAKYLYHQLQKTQRPIKTALLDPAVVAGLGNIYADEVLFQSRIHPKTPARELTADRVDALAAAIVDVLQRAIAAGGTTFSSYTNVHGINGNYIGQAWVYGRGDLPCRVCDRPISKIRLGGRGTHYCDRCQGD
jgi:formamidopyrimidine-DNA glycosylase